MDVTFLKSQKHLTSMQLAQTAWQYEDVEHYEMNTVRNEVAIGEEVFQLSKDTQYFSQGHSIEKMDLNPADILTFHGMAGNRPDTDRTDHRGHAGDCAGGKLSGRYQL